MELWIPITVGAAFFQNVRSALQKHLTGELSTSGATYVRFCYAAPLALAIVVGLTGVVLLSVGGMKRDEKGTHLFVHK